VDVSERSAVVQPGSAISRAEIDWINGCSHAASMGGISQRGMANTSVVDLVARTDPKPSRLEGASLRRLSPHPGGCNGLLAATVPDETYSWIDNQRELRAEIWRQLVLKHMTPVETNKTFDVYAIYDPDFPQPWLLAVPFKLKPESVRAIYKDRWPVEQIPLAAKQMVGAHRQFVSNSESIQRLPELALLAGSILSFLAATAPAVATGFWDRQPKRTPGRFRRTLMGKPFPKDAQLSGQLRKKNSETTHLPKGILARQTKVYAALPCTAT
jgi:hypothetical protein